MENHQDEEQVSGVRYHLEAANIGPQGWDKHSHMNFPVMATLYDRTDGLRKKLEVGHLVDVSSGFVDADAFYDPTRPTAGPECKTDAHFYTPTGVKYKGSGEVHLCLKCLDSKAVKDHN